MDFACIYAFSNFDCHRVNVHLTFEFALVYTVGKVREDKEQLELIEMTEDWKKGKQDR
jgi:hypothetical protein